jgi:hypothetical protein
MVRVRRGEHGRARCDALLGQAVVHVGRREQAETGVVVLVLYQGKKTWQCARASWIDPKRTGNAGRYFSVLNWASENGLSWLSGSARARTTCIGARVVDLDTPRRCGTRTPRRLRQSAVAVTVAVSRRRGPRPVHFVSHRPEPEQGT